MAALTKFQQKYTLKVKDSPGKARAYDGGTLINIFKFREAEKTQPHNYTIFSENLFIIESGGGSP